MKNIIATFIITTFCAANISAQNVHSSSVAMIDTLSHPQMAMPMPPLTPGVSPYKISWKVDAPIIATGVGLTVLGVKLIGQKKDLTVAEYATKVPANVWGFDRGNAGVYSERADEISYIPFHASFAMPVLVGLLDKNHRKNYGQVMVLYMETMAITGAAFTMAAGTVQRSRPFVYGRNNGLDDEYKRNGNNQRSFFAGHTAATAAATFYTAKVFNDFNPDSKARTYVWIAAAAVPAVVGYYRHKAGMHFLSDNILGYAVGAATGILVPHFHRKKIKNLSVVPEIGGGYRGLAATYKL